jgi:hypothetical protein
MENYFDIGGDGVITAPSYSSPSPSLMNVTAWLLIVFAILNFAIFTVACVVTAKYKPNEDTISQLITDQFLDATNSQAQNILNDVETLVNGGVRGGLVMANDIFRSLMNRFKIKVV